MIILEGSKIGLNVDKSKASKRFQNRDYVFQKNSRLNINLLKIQKRTKNDYNI